MTCDVISCGRRRGLTLAWTVGLFSLSGVIRTALPNMDRETRDQYVLIIQAKDMVGQMGGLSGTTSVTVTLTDVNDNPPRFSHSKTPSARLIYLNFTLTTYMPKLIRLRSGASLSERPVSFRDCQINHPRRRSANGFAVSLCYSEAGGASHGNPKHQQSG